MFTPLIDELRADVEKVKAILRSSEAFRNELYSVPSSATGAGGGPAPPDKWRELRLRCPGKIDWQIFDHCAAFTRLYAIYEQYVTDLITGYLVLVPELYPQYTGLPEESRTQHRVAVGQILQKWSEDGPYRGLTELGIVQGLAAGLRGEASYALLPDAFLIDPNNYRGEVIRRLFKYLGFADFWAGVENAPAMVAFIANRRGTSETADTILKDIVGYRNDASHGKVGDVVSIEGIASYGDFLVILCDALCIILKRAVLRRRLALNHVAKIGAVLKTFGRAIGVKLEPGAVAVGEEVILQRGETINWGCIESIRKGSTPHARFSTEHGEEIGLALSTKAAVGTELYRVSVPIPPISSPSAQGAAEPNERDNP